MFLLADRPDVQDAIWRSFENEAIRLLTLGRLAEREGIDTVFTVDRNDFSAYRLSGRRRIKMVP